MQPRGWHTNVGGWRLENLSDGIRGLFQGGQRRVLCCENQVRVGWVPWVQVSRTIKWQVVVTCELPGCGSGSRSSLYSAIHPVRAVSGPGAYTPPLDRSHDLSLGDHFCAFVPEYCLTTVLSDPRH